MLEVSRALKIFYIMLAQVGWLLLDVDTKGLPPLLNRYIG